MLIKQQITVEGDLPAIEISDPHPLVADPVASVSMITYNHEPYIAQAIEGVLKQQTDFPFELVIGEDCSTDDTAAIVRSFAEQYPGIIRIITAESNVGVKANSWRNQWACRGKYVAYCEGDDYWHDPKKLQMQVDMLEENDELVLVYTDLDYYYQDKDVRIPYHNRRLGRRYDKPLTPQQQFRQILYSQGGGTNVTVCVRASVLQEVLRSDRHVFRDSYFPMGDTPRALELALRGRFGYLDRSTATIRRLSESASRSADFSRLAENSLKSMELRFYYRDRIPLDPSEFERRMSGRARVGLYRACMAGDKEIARKFKNLLPNLTGANRVLYWCTANSLLNRSVRPVLRAAIQLRRLYRRIRYGVESSV